MLSGYGISANFGSSHDRPVLKDISLTIYDDTEAGFHGPVGW